VGIGPARNPTLVLTLSIKYSKYIDLLDCPHTIDAYTYEHVLDYNSYRGDNFLL